MKLLKNLIDLLNNENENNILEENDKCSNEQNLNSRKNLRQTSPVNKVSLKQLHDTYENDDEDIVVVDGDVDDSDLDYPNCQQLNNDDDMTNTSQDDEHDDDDDVEYGQSRNASANTAKNNRKKGNKYKLVKNTINFDDSEPNENSRVYFELQALEKFK